MRLLFGGVRGSTPAPGAEFVRVGGHTSCVGVAKDEGLPRLILDAGTGLRRLDNLFAGQPFRGTILLSHLHWDHVQGLPFFTSGDRDDAEVDLIVPQQNEALDALTVMSRAMSPPHFPIDPTGLHGRWMFASIDEGQHRIEAFDVKAIAVRHKGGATFGYRISDGSRSVAYVPDHEAEATGPADGLVEGVDVLVHDAQFLADERAVARDYGHSTVDDAIALATRSGVGCLVLFHHAPNRTDDAIDKMVESLPTTSFPITVATDGLELRI